MGYRFHTEAMDRILVPEKTWRTHFYCSHIQVSCPGTGFPQVGAFGGIFPMTIFRPSHVPYCDMEWGEGTGAHTASKL